jgi:hypothetical protein
MSATDSVVTYSYKEKLEWCKINIVTDLFKAFLGNGSVNAVNVQQWKMCLSGLMLLHVARQQRTNEDAG